MRAAKPRSPGAFQWPEGKRAAVSLSFDDARTTQVDRGLALLAAHGVRATFYVSPGAVEARLAGWRDAVRAGHEIGNHTMTHPCSGNFAFSRANALEDYTLERMERELTDANAAVREMLGVTPSTFAYPCGQTFVGRGAGARSYVPLVARHFAVGRGAFSETHNSPALCDLAQVNSLDLDDAPIERITALVDACRAEGSWLIFFGHEIGDAGRQVTRAATLDAFCRAAARPDSGLWLDTVAAVGNHILSARAL